MSFVIEINGIKVEGETLKEATRLAKKEEKRQVEEEKAKEGRRDIAYTIAYSEIGRFATHLDRRPWFYSQNITPTPDGCYSYSVRVEQKTTAFFRTNDHVTTTLSHADGTIYGARLSVLDTYYWLFFGVYEGELAIETAPDYMADRLEHAYQAELSKAA